MAIGNLLITNGYNPPSLFEQMEEDSMTDPASGVMRFGEDTRALRAKAYMGPAPQISLDLRHG